MNTTLRHHRSLLVAFLVVLAFGALVAGAAFLPGTEDAGSLPAAAETVQDGERAAALDATADGGAGMAAAMLLVALLTGGGIAMAMWLARRLDLEW